ncbi:hypothetical protein [Embleya sp. NPDC059259]|uniref:hypothetical protein n=1 Tax=unclassified Embleya TaxID=2699296 RepID=UPI00368CDEB4
MEPGLSAAVGLLWLPAIRRLAPVAISSVYTCPPLPRDRCGSGHRTSRFKSAPGCFTIPEVALRSTPSTRATPVNDRYLARAFDVPLGATPSHPWANPLPASWPTGARGLLPPAHGLDNGATS